MFLKFFYTLKEAGIPVSPTSFLLLQKALYLGVVNSLNDFYNAARSILVKSEKYFDLYDQIFSYYFENIPLNEDINFELDEFCRLLLEQWLSNPKEVSNLLDLTHGNLKHLSPDELIEYFKKRLLDQDGRHDGGSKWIGTGGTSPVGHSGFHPNGMRVGGNSKNKSAVKVAAERRYRDYSIHGNLSLSSMGEAMKRLKNMVKAGSSTKVNIDSTIYQTIKNAGEIEVVFEPAKNDKLKVVLMIDNGGWSMDPYVPLVQSLFHHARNNFKELQIFYFHNTIYQKVWKDPARRDDPFPIINFNTIEPETRLIILGDASMALNELLGYNGAINISDSSTHASIRSLNYLSKQFPRAVWLNPVSEGYWQYTETITMISQVFHMFPLTLDGIENAINSLMRK